MNAAEALVGSQDLIGLRSRGVFSRPFTVIESLQEIATDRYRQQEQALIAQLRELEQQLELLQPLDSIEALEHDAAGLEDEHELTEQQHQELRIFERKRLRVRRQLRQVQHQLNQDIESLQRDLKWVNFLSVPVLCILLLGGLYLYRRYFKLKLAR